MTGVHRFKLFRYDPETGESGYKDYEVPALEGMPVLGALFWIRDRIDPTLSFRSSCRGAVCGTCAMMINRVPRLACRTQVRALLEGDLDIELKPHAGLEEEEVEWDPSREVLVEPLPNLSPVKDLVAHMDPFFEAYMKVRPVFEPENEVEGGRERLMEPSAVKELEMFTNCILCGLCYGSCPVNSVNPEYLGPAALAKLFRFHLDPREKGDGARLELAVNENGWTACEFHTNCRKVCPKGVPPNLAIGKAKRELKKLLEDH